MLDLLREICNNARHTFYNQVKQGTITTIQAGIRIWDQST